MKYGRFAAAFFSCLFVITVVFAGILIMMDRQRNDGARLPQTGTQEETVVVQEPQKGETETTGESETREDPQGGSETQEDPQEESNTMEESEEESKNDTTQDTPAAGEGDFDGYDDFGNGYVLKDGIRYFDCPCPYPLKVMEEKDGVVTWYQEGTKTEATMILATETLRAKYRKAMEAAGLESYSLKINGGLDDGPCVGVYDGHIIFHGTVTGEAVLSDGTVVH